MRDIKRITIDHKGLPFFDEDGVYVSYEDYAKLEDRLARSDDYCLGVDMDRMEYIAKCDALVAECSQYKSLAERFAERADDYKSEHFGYSVFDSSNEFKQHTKTPVTDAYLNALRAEGLKMAIDHMNNQTSDNCADVTVLPVIEMYNQLRAGKGGE